MFDCGRGVAFVCGCAGSLLVVGCSSNDAPAGESPPDEPYLGLVQPAPGEGFQVRSRGVDVQPGDDVEYCEVAELPGEVDDVYFVGALEFGNGAYSHHLIIEAAKDGTPAADSLAARALGERVPCLTSQSEFGAGLEFLGLAQSPYRAYEYPKGVGRKFHGKQRLVFNYHYFNVGDDVAEARSAVNFHLTAEEDVEHIAQTFAYANTTIDTPPLQSRSFTGECHAAHDMQVFELTRHTHQWGKDFAVWYAGGPRDGEHVFTSPSYEEDVDHVFSPVVAVKSGEGFRFRCDFENTESHPLRYGPNATDEMCTLYGLWWSESSNDPAPDVCILTQVGSDGIARSRSETTFPEPTPEEAAACFDSVDGDGEQPISDCTRCSCEHCAHSFNRCFDDPDCRVILDCIATTACRGTECIATCEDVFNAHSVGTGPLIQFGECTTALCPACG